ncbi:Enoyl-[acyl-carrier-protein] reductase [Bacillus subtilis]|nr:Enoyl-[acyl-carrier-protein] reductase [Bacillus subtilis]RPK20172.1 Enoyl-[acyl-carrier-protein] reductase [Bacillus subtilis]
MTATTPQEAVLLEERGEKDSGYMSLWAGQSVGMLKRAH